MGKGNGTQIKKKKGNKKERKEKWGVRSKKNGEEKKEKRRKEEKGKEGEKKEKEKKKKKNTHTPEASPAPARPRTSPVCQPYASRQHPPVASPARDQHSQHTTPAKHSPACQATLPASHVSPRARACQHYASPPKALSSSPSSITPETFAHELTHLACSSFARPSSPNRQLAQQPTRSSTPRPLAQSPALPTHPESPASSPVRQLTRGSRCVPTPLLSMHVHG